MTGNARKRVAELRTFALENPEHFSIYAIFETILMRSLGALSSTNIDHYFDAIQKQVTFSQPQNRAYALQTKIGYIQDSPFSAQIKSDICTELTEHLHKFPESGFGRFRKFNMGIRVPVASHRRGSVRLLKLLQEIHCTTDVDKADRIAERLCNDSEVPFKRFSRFSELLHLSNPQLYPFISLENYVTISGLMGLDALVSTRFDYMELLPYLRLIPLALDVPNYNIADVILARIQWLLKEELVDDFVSQVEFLQELLQSVPEDYE